jgi:polysaccharide deacetylase 2 family uncharacterized protein YibQ
MISQILKLIFLLILFNILTCNNVFKTKKRKNVLLIVADDLGMQTNHTLKMIKLIKSIRLV